MNCHQLNKPEEEKRWINKRNKIINKMNNARIEEVKALSSDSLRGPYTSVASDVDRDVAARNQPGRYSQRSRKDVHEEPGFWKD